MYEVMRAQSDLEQFYVRMMLLDFCNLFQCMLDNQRKSRILSQTCINEIFIG